VLVVCSFFVVLVVVMVLLLGQPRLSVYMVEREVLMVLLEQVE
jgi:hypothetical protein